MHTFSGIAEVNDFYNFDEIIDHRNSFSLNWDSVQNDILPGIAFVDMLIKALT